MEQPKAKKTDAEKEALLDAILAETAEKSALTEPKADPDEEAEAEAVAETVTETEVEAVTEPETNAQPESEAAPSGEEDQKAEADNAEKPKRKRGSFRTILTDTLDLIESVIISVFVVMLCFTYLFCVANVDGDSMVPTLADRDRLLVNRMPVEYKTGDILILDCHSSHGFDENGDVTSGTGIGKRIVKRLIAQAGQDVYIDFAEGIVYVDGEPLDEPYVQTLTTRDNGAFTYPLTIPDGYIFVLGDNRSVSKDSRHPDIGLVAVHDIIGKVILRLTPFTAFGEVE